MGASMVISKLFTNVFTKKDYTINLYSLSLCIDSSISNHPHDRITSID